MHYPTIVQSVVLRLLVVRPSVCLSVRLTLVDQDHIGWKTCKLIARTISPTIFALRITKAIHLLPGEHGEIVGRLEGVGKSGVLEHTIGNISETHKDRGKVTTESL